MPSAVILLVAGALAGVMGVAAPGLAGAAAVGALCADLLWFEVARRRGRGLIRLYCKVTLGSQSCTARTERALHKFGPTTLVFAKFLPGLSIFAAPMAGLSGMSRRRFFALDGIGALLWAGTMVGAGSALGIESFEAWYRRAAQLGSWPVAALGAAMATFLAMRIYRRAKSGPARMPGEHA